MSVLRSRCRIPRWDFTMRFGRIALLLAISLIAGAAPAQAQFFGLFGNRNTQPPAQLTPQDVVQRLSRAGFRVMKLRLNGTVFLADANDRAGQPLRLVVSATDGAILQRFASTNPRVGAPDGGLPPPQPGYAPSAPGAGETAPGMRPRAAAPRAKPAPAEATLAPAPTPAPAPSPTVTAAPPPLAPAPIQPMVGPGFANGVPINPLD